MKKPMLKFPRMGKGFPAPRNKGKKSMWLEFNTPV